MSGSFDLTLGLDLRPQTTGAIQYAVWLCKSAGLVPTGHIQPVHVIEPLVMEELLRHGDEETILGSFAVSGKNLLDEVARGAHLRKPEVGRGPVRETLEARALERGSTALIVSRRAATGTGLKLTRLGSVARRLLRTLKVPVIVTPPDLLESRVGEGPVVVAVDFEPGAERAVEWAKQMAGTIGRELIVLHVADMPDQLGYGGFVQAERWDKLTNEILDRGRERMASFQAEHEGFAELNSTVIRGPVLPAILDYSVAAKACLVVTGSGHHGLAHRILVPSIASETAAISAVPVAVVGHAG